MLKLTDLKPYFSRESMRKLVPQKNQRIAAAGLVALFLVVYYGYFAIDAYRNARQMAGLVEPLKTSAAARDWQGTIALLDAAEVNLSEFERDLDKLYPFTLLPLVSNEAASVRSLIAAGKLSLASARPVILWAEGVPLLSETSVNSFSELTEQDKAAFLKAISDSTVLWERVANQTGLALVFLEDARRTTRFSSINSKINQLSEKLLAGQTVFNRMSPWIGAAPRVLGYPGEKTYLLLLQNNTELRPTGGFIGTYGVLRVRNAGVVSFTTDNVYNLDEPAKAYNEKIPPAPLQRYIKQSQWFLRDSNWDPDFPTSAARAIQFYKDERGPVSRFDGVIALTPTVVEELMGVLGPIAVNGKEFTSQNLIDELAYHVELGFKGEGITIYNRKEIIDDVARELKEKVFSMSLDQLRLLVPIVLDALGERQLLVYFEDEVAQRLAESMQWAGQVAPADGDYFFVVDANLGSLKSDPAINRTISYALAPGADGKMSATVSVTYEHTGDFDWKTTRYRTYTRLYVPRGSTFVAARGNEEPVAVSDEHGKTVFGTFISIEPLTSETLSFTYTLPKELASRIAEGRYSLYIQKQGGTTPHQLELDLAVPFNINRREPQKVLDKESGNRVQGAWDLARDRTITLTK
ncbi:MAG: DUF4012 domain-containing protein [Parcubacteria group bacterium]|nr:DUF4012 domain-containing protein [Parcubacteria group bacterium]